MSGRMQRSRVRSLDAVGRCSGAISSLCTIKVQCCFPVAEVLNDSGIVSRRSAKLSAFQHVSFNCTPAKALSRCRGVASPTPKLIGSTRTTFCFGPNVDRDPLRFFGLLDRIDRIRIFKVPLLVDPTPMPVWWGRTFFFSEKGRMLW
jgi:hypothetical protein